MNRPREANGTRPADLADRRSMAADSVARPSAFPCRSQRFPSPSQRFPERTVARHVLRRGHTYYFRARHFLARRGAPTHMCVSLRTRDHDEALRRATKLEVVMAGLREQAAQRLVEPGMIAQCVHRTVAEFSEPTLSSADAERLARMVRERCDHADEVRLAKSSRLWDWAGERVPPASMDADVLETYADEYREALATGDLTVGLRSVADYADALDVLASSPLVRRMMARVILREMAESCERMAARYRDEVVPYLDRSLTDDSVRDSLAKLDELERDATPFPSDAEIADRTSSASIRSDVIEDEPNMCVDAQAVDGSLPQNVAEPVRDDAPAEATSPSREVEHTDDLAREDSLDADQTVVGIWSLFAADMMSASGKWNGDNAKHSKSVARLWERVHHDLPIRNIQPRHAQELRRIALNLPSLHAKAVVWTQRPIREVATIFAQLPRDSADDDEFDGVPELVETLEAANRGRPIDREILSLAAWNRNASWLRAFGRWLVNNNLNPHGEEIFGDLHVNVDEDAEEERRGRRPGRPLWTRTQAEALFQTPLFVGSQCARRRHKPGDWLTGDALYWIVLIASTTGMRREEIAQLRVKHVKKHQPADASSPIWYFCLSTRGLKLKNKESRRDVPVPDALLQLGLIEALIVGRKTDEMLLGDVTRNAQGRYGDVPGKAFGRYRTALPKHTVGYGDDAEVIDFGAPLLDLHAFRHSMATWLIDADVSQSVAEELLGHRSPERRTAFARYDHGRMLERLKTAVDAVAPPFDPVQLRALRIERYRPRAKVKANRRRQAKRPG